MGAYESLENEKTKVFPSFFVVALLSLSGDIVSVGFKCLSSKAKIDILRKYDKLTLGEPLGCYMSCFSVWKCYVYKILVLKLKVVQELSK